MKIHIGPIFEEIRTQCPHPYHNMRHTFEVVERIRELTTQVTPPLLTEEVDLLIWAATFHDYGHCGQTIRQMCEREVPRRDLSNEEYAATVAVELLHSVYNGEQLAKLRNLILATSFGQTNPQFQYYRPYGPETLLEKLLALADIGGFVNGLEAWVEESVRVLQESDISDFPTDFESWLKNRQGFVEYVRGTLQKLEHHLKPTYYRQLTEQIDEIALGVENGLKGYRSRFDCIRVDRIATMST